MRAIILMGLLLSSPCFAQSMNIYNLSEKTIYVEFFSYGCEAVSPKKKYPGYCAGAHIEPGDNFEYVWTEWINPFFSRVSRIFTIDEFIYEPEEFSVCEVYDAKQRKVKCY